MRRRLPGKWHRPADRTMHRAGPVTTSPTPHLEPRRRLAARGHRPRVGLRRVHDDREGPGAMSRRPHPRSASRSASRVVAALWLVGLHVGGLDTGLLFLAPAFVLALPLLAGRYVGERRSRAPPARPAVVRALRLPARPRGSCRAAGSSSAAPWPAARRPRDGAALRAPTHPQGRSEPHQLEKEHSPYMHRKVAVSPPSGRSPLPAAAQAHVTLQPNAAPAGAFMVLDVRVPNEQRQRRDHQGRRPVPGRLRRGLLPGDARLDGQGRQEQAGHADPDRRRPDHRGRRPHDLDRRQRQGGHPAGPVPRLPDLGPGARQGGQHADVQGAADLQHR